jgi:hypothetical protein
MSKIIKQSWTEHIAEFEHCFSWKNDPHAGFGFPCDEQGNIDKNSLHPSALENLNMCLNSDEIIDKGIVDYSRDFRHKPILKCDCGVEFGLYGDSMGECGCPKCDRVYNIFGQKLVGFTRPWSGMNDCGEYYY